VLASSTDRTAIRLARQTSGLTTVTRTRSVLVGSRELRSRERPGTPRRRPLSVPPASAGRSAAVGWDWKGRLVIGRRSRPIARGSVAPSLLEEGGRRKDRRPKAEDRSEAPDSSESGLSRCPCP